jgi:potassium efflux system protein
VESGELRDRSYTVDELNRTIDRLCRENDINIAFNQLEVHLRNEKGDELTEAWLRQRKKKALPSIR